MEIEAPSNGFLEGVQQKWLQPGLILFVFFVCLFVVVVAFHRILLIFEKHRSSQGVGVHTSCIPPLDPSLCFLNMKGWLYVDNARQCTMKFQKIAHLISFALLIKLLVTLCYDTIFRAASRMPMNCTCHSCSKWSLIHYGLKLHCQPSVTWSQRHWQWGLITNDPLSGKLGGGVDVPMLH